MANRTDPLARTIHGTNPQNLVEKIVRSKIYQNTFWKEQCFGLTAETLVDKAMEIDHIGGTFGGNRKPTPFICLVLKMLQIQPDKEIVVEFIKNDDYKYVRALGAFYLRLTGTDADVYSYLEPLYNDYRKLRMKLPEGKYSLTHVDDFVDHLLTKDYACDIALPRIKKRWTLENIGSLEPRKSVLEDDFFEEEDADLDQLDGTTTTGASDQASGKDRDRDKERGRDKDGYRDGDRDRDRRHNRHRDREYERHYESERNGRGRERDRDRDRDRHRRDEKEHEHEHEHERNRDGRERRGRGRGRRRSHSRSRSRSRDRKRHQSGSPPHDDGKKRKPKKDDGTDHPDPEIAEANKLRAKLGLAPLRP